MDQAAEESPKVTGAGTGGQRARTVLVTGGNRGIGAAIAEAFVAQGDRVAVTHRDAQVPEGTFGVECDVTDSASVDAAFKAVEQQLGPVEILVANAGMTADGLLLRMREEQFLRVLDTNLAGAWRCSRRAIAPMLKAGRGRLILMSSVAGLYGSAGQTNYAASKAGLVGLARSITREYGARNVVANVVAPGLIDTDMTAALTEAARQDKLRDIPMARSASAQEVAGAVTWLAGDQAAYVAGAVIPVDGGLCMGH
ncbi:3-oxoacyl-ACP reductase FabG [Streptomyces sp. NPDC003038]|uniref:3-oxoacyl-ACP reductase FabG n=1 Tax=unclassified Streptomyces TaxID=2593676 RepID=UPI0033B9AF60